MVKSLRQGRKSSHLQRHVATRCGIDDGKGSDMADEDLFKDGGGKNALGVRRLYRDSLAPHDRQVPHRTLT